MLTSCALSKLTYTKQVRQVAAQLRERVVRQILGQCNKVRSSFWHGLPGISVGRAKKLGKGRVLPAALARATSSSKLGRVSAMDIFASENFADQDAALTMPQKRARLNQAWKDLPAD